MQADVVIVGAGLSGMIAARKLLEAGLKPLVLEADDRVGGRILTEVVDGVPLELGAQWIGDTHQRMFDLAAELGVKTFAQSTRARRPTSSTARVCCASTTFTPATSPELAEVEGVLRRLDVLAAEVPVDAPWPAPRAAEWDAITAGAWYDAQDCPPSARTLLEICTVGILAVPTAEVSFLHLLFTIQTCGVTAELFAESEGGAQTTRFVGGTSEIPRRLADLIANHIVLNVTGAAHRALRRQRDGALPRRARRARAPGDRRDLPDVGRPDHVRPTASRRARPTHPTAAKRIGDEGILRLPRTLLAGQPDSTAS